MSSQAVLLRIHNNHRDTIEALLIALAKAGVASYIGSGPVNEASLQKFQEFWFNIGREVVGVASEFSCGESANQLVFAVVSAYSHSNGTNALGGLSSSNISSGAASYQGPASLDMRIFLDKVLSPVSAYIARGV